MSGPSTPASTQGALPKHVCRIGDTDWHGDKPPALDDSVCGARQVEPWLSAILQAEHLSLLVGNGITTAAVKLAGGQPIAMDGELRLDEQLAAKVESEASAEASRMLRGAPNIEDRLRASLIIESALRILGDPRSTAIRSAIDGALLDLVEAVLSAEAAMDAAPSTASAATDKYSPAGYLVAFLLAFASRTPTRDRLHVFTTNYDRLVEDACDRAGLRVIDRFVGTVRPRFRSSRLDVDIHYSPPGIRGEPRFLEGVLRLTKMHGSVDWQLEDGEVIRRHIGFGDRSRAVDAANASMLIYPQSSKDVETGLFPYADLFRDFSAALCRPNSVLVTYGYGFGDDHINRVIRDMLTLPSTHVVVISWDDAGGRIGRFIEANHGSSQTSQLIGSHFGDLRTLVEHYLPRPAIDDITWRRARLLRNRAVPFDSSNVEDSDDDTE